MHLLADGYLAALFSLSPIGRKSVGEVKRLLSRTIEIRILRQLDCSVEYRNAVLVHLTVSKLDVRTRRD